MSEGTGLLCLRHLWLEPLVGGELEMLHLLDRVVKALVSHLHIDGMEALAVHVMKLRVNLWATLQHLW